MKEGGLTIVKSSKTVVDTPPEFIRSDRKTTKSIQTIPSRKEDRNEELRIHMASSAVSVPVAFGEVHGRYEGIGGGGLEC